MSYKIIDELQPEDIVKLYDSLIEEGNNKYIGAYYNVTCADGTIRHAYHSVCYGRVDSCWVSSCPYCPIESAACPNESSDRYTCVVSCN